MLGRADAGVVAKIPGTEGGAAPVWPIPGYSYFSGTSFGGDRPSNCEGERCKRYHCGVDVHAPWGTYVVATEAGVVLNTQGWASKKGRTDRTSKALLLQLDNGPVIVYGGLAPNSWAEVGVGIGTRVTPGQPVGKVGYYPNGSTMLHIEGRKKGTRIATPWEVNTPPPANLRNLTPYLKLAKRSADPSWSRFYDRKKEGAPPPPPPPPPAPPPDDDEIVILDDEPITPAPAPRDTEQGQWTPYQDPEPIPPPSSPGILSRAGQALHDALRELDIW